MAETKTKPTTVSVTEFLAQIEDPQKRADSKTLIDLMSRATGKKQKMWGRDIVGFGEYHYRYASGQEGDAPLVAFSPRKSEFSIYLYGAEGDVADRSELLARLGKHRMGKACLYVKRLDQIDTAVLEQLVENSIVTLKSMYPTK
jgi:hypothetical protein